MGTIGSLGDSESHRVILFDGVCNLCNGAVQFVIKHDRKKKFKFASLQSKHAQKLLKSLGKNTTSMQTIMLVDNNRIFEKSNAVLQIARHLSGLWPLLYGFKIVPKIIRDAAYTLVAKNRYYLFGKRESCMLPSPELKGRFIDN